MPAVFRTAGFGDLQPKGRGPRVHGDRCAALPNRHGHRIRQRRQRPVAALAVLLVTKPGNVFMVLTTVVTVALTVAGTGASALRFLSVLRRLGLKLCFAQPEPGRGRRTAPEYERSPTVQQVPALPAPLPAGSRGLRTACLSVSPVIQVQMAGPA
jgi:hypothetical protein